MTRLRTVDDDVADYERTQQQIDLLRATSPKIERIRAKRDIKVARANSTNSDTRIARYIAAAAAVAIMSISGCSAVVWGGPEIPNTPEKDAQIHDEKLACIKSKGEWIHGSCSF